MLRKSGIITLGFVFLLLLSFQAQAQEVLNLSDNSADSEYPAIAVNHLGQVMAVWSDNGTIYYRLYSDGAWSPTYNAFLRVEFAIISQLDVDSQGNFHISYSDGYTSSTRDIFYSLYEAGKGWASPDRVCENGLNSAWNRIAVDGSTVYIMWYQEVGGSSEAEIALNSKAIAGRWPDSWENVSRNSGLTSIHPAFDAVNGQIFSVYMEGTESNWDIVFSERRSGEWQDSYPVGYSHWPALSADSYQNVYAAFFGGGRFNYRERIDGRWRDLEVISSGAAQKGFGDVKAKNNLVAAAWSQDNGQGVSIFYRYKYLGSSWPSAQELAAGSEAYYPLIALDDAGYAHFVWEDLGQAGQRDIYYRKVFLTEPDRPSLALDRTLLSFTANQGEKKSQIFRVRNAGSGELNYTLSANKSWLSVFPLTGSSSGEWDEITVTVDTSSLSAGDYTGTVTVTSAEAANSPRALQVNLKVIAAPPALELTPTSLSFTATEGEASPASQAFRVRNSGSGTLNYTVSANKSWVSVTPSGGTSSGEWDTITVALDITGLEVGDYQAQVSVSSPDAANSPQKVNVSLRVNLPPNPYAPVNVKQEKVNFVGLFIQVYLNRLSWSDNPKNSGNFTVAKFIIYRKKQGETDEKFVPIGEVKAGSPLVYVEEFADPKERDSYAYCVTAVDDQGRESKRAKAASSSSPAVSPSPGSSSSRRQIQGKKLRN